MRKAIILGTAQDGGYPHAGCVSACCEGARTDAARVRRVACLGLVADGEGFLVDATPDLPRQVHALPRLSGILLTHAHMGHIAGLLWLGREAMSVRKLPLFVGPRLLYEHLEENEPWATLLANGHVVPRVVEAEKPFEPAPGLSVTAIAVPHRGEWSETFAYRISGPDRTILWLPDIDRFPEGALETWLEGVDLAFLDGTFWSAAELTGRNPAEVPHPALHDTARRLAGLRPRAAVSFVHLNHTNPCLDPASAEAAELAGIYREAGLRSADSAPIAAEGTELSL